MNQKEYDLIASNLTSLKKTFVDINGGNSRYNAGKYDSWYVIVMRLNTEFMREYPKTFDSQKFLKACGIGT